MELEHELEDVRAECDRARVNEHMMQQRLRRLGSEEHEYFDSDQVLTIDVEAEPVMYGNYVMIDDSSFGTEIVEQAKDRLVKSLARSMAELDIVQFIVRSAEETNDPLNQFATVGAKLRVIPWEQMTKRKIVFKQVVQP